MPAFRVLLTDYAWPELEIERRLLAAIDAELIVSPTGDEAQLCHLAAAADAILTCWAPVTAQVIRAAPRCRIIARLGIGLDNIDLEVATQCGIPVVNVPGYCLPEVAEHTLALLLALGRKVAWYHLETKHGRYQRDTGPPLVRLSTQTLGIVGLGAIGCEVARRAQAFGMQVLACGRKPHSRVPGVVWQTLDQLLARSDYVSLHVPLASDTRHLIGRRQLEQMKPGAFLINTARGGLVDTQALAEALQRGNLAGAALDVQDPEPPNLEVPPWNDPRVIVTPHAAFSSRQSLAELRSRAVQQIVDRFQGRCPPHVVNDVVIA